MSDMARENATQDVVTLADVRMLTGTAGPCITLAMPISNSLEFVARLKSALRSLQKQLAERHTRAETIASLLAPIEQLGPNWETAEVWANSLIAFRAPGAFRHYWVRDRRKDVAVVGNDSKSARCSRRWPGNSAFTCWRSAATMYAFSVRLRTARKKCGSKEKRRRICRSFCTHARPITCWKAEWPPVPRSDRGKAWYSAPAPRVKKSRTA